MIKTLCICFNFKQTSGKIVVFISIVFIPFLAVVTNKSELFLPPKEQLVIFFAGKFNIFIFFPNLLKIDIHPPL